MNTFSVFDAVIIGAIGAAAFLLVVVAVVVAVWKVWPLLVELTAALTKLSKTATAMVPGVNGINSELAHMREMAVQQQVGGTPAALSFEQESRAAERAEGEAGKAPSRTTFPDQVLDRFPIVPDAKVEDTDMGGLTQTDAELVDIEKIEALRQQGIEVEDDDTPHEGVTAEA